MDSTCQAAGTPRLATQRAWGLFEADRLPRCATTNLPAPPSDPMTLAQVRCIDQSVVVGQRHWYSPGIVEMRDLFDVIALRVQLPTATGSWTSADQALGTTHAHHAKRDVISRLGFALLTRPYVFGDSEASTWMSDSLLRSSANVQALTTSRVARMLFRLRLSPRTPAPCPRNHSPSRVGNSLNDPTTCPNAIR